jgi:arginyl-tRNA synthetase
MLQKEIAGLIEKAIKKAQQKGDLPKFEAPEVVVDHPKDDTHGDYACPVCLPMARLAKMAPVAIAEKVVARMQRPEYVGAVEIAHPGFINITLSPEWLAKQVEVIIDAGEAFGQIDVGHNQSVQVEFISANPTGPLTIGSGRNAVLGDTLANILSAAGWRVEREYYVNDTGNQMDIFGASLYARYVQALGVDEPLPEDGYPGAYLVDMGREIADEVGDEFLKLERAEAVAALRAEGLRRMLIGIRQDAEALGVLFDVWKSEQSLYDDGLYGTVFNKLSAEGRLKHRDGAIWFRRFVEGEDQGAAEDTSRAKDGGEDVDKDNVVVRSDGRPTYFASDIAYVWDKLVERRFDTAIYVWGADHHGHVPRMKAVTAALGLDPDRAIFILYQLVTLKRGGELVRIGKRTGEIITLREVIEEIGADATRFMLLTRSADSQMELDLTLAAEQSSENPVYYVQYGHARIASIVRKAEERGVSLEGGDVSMLTHPMELALIRQMLRLPEVVGLCAGMLAPHHLAPYALELASAFHSFYKECRVMSDEPGHAPLGAARMKLVLAAKIALANTLTLMGVSAPESM